MRTGNTIYLDHQASTPLDEAVFEEMLPFLAESFANPHSSDHTSGWAAAAAVNAASTRIGALIGCDNDEIIYTSGATEANNLAILGCRGFLNKRERNQIVTTNIEHKSTIAACAAMSDEYGAELTACKVGSDGRIDLDHLEEILSERVLLLSIGAVNSEIGTIQDIEAINALALRFGVVVHLDAAQMPLAGDMSGAARYADMISLSGHKIYGPKGIGCLYVTRQLQNSISPLIYGGGQQQGIRSGTLPVPLCVGMGAAAALLHRSPQLREALRTKTQKLWDGLSSLDWEIALNGPSIPTRHPGNLNVRFAGFFAEELLGALQPSLAVSTGSACTSGTPEASHVLRAVGLSDEEARSSIRFGVGRFTTDKDIACAVELVVGALERIEGAGLRKAV